MKTLIKLDLLVYIIVSLIAFMGGVYLITTPHESTAGTKNVSEAFVWLGGFALLIGIAGVIVTFIKIRDTFSK